MEAKRAVWRVRKISNVHIFEILSFFGGRAQPMMAQLAEAGKLTRADVRELEKTIDRIERQRKGERVRR